MVASPGETNRDGGALHVKGGLTCFAPGLKGPGLRSKLICSVDPHFWACGMPLRMFRLNGLSALANLYYSPCEPAAAFCCIQSASYAKQVPAKPKLAQSKASQKATETKAASKAGRDSSAAVANQRVKLMLDALMPQERPRPQRSAEDLADAAERARNFSRLKMQQHR